jgi:hypothetical protein
MSDLISIAEPVNGFVVKAGRVLKATLVGIDTSSRSTIVLYEEENSMQVSDDFRFFTQRFAAEFAAGET